MCSYVRCSKGHVSLPGPLLLQLTGSGGYLCSESRAGQEKSVRTGAQGPRWQLTAPASLKRGRVSSGNSPSEAPSDGKCFDFRYPGLSCHTPRNFNAALKNTEV